MTELEKRKLDGVAAEAPGGCASDEPPEDVPYQQLESQVYFCQQDYASREVPATRWVKIGPVKHLRGEVSSFAPR
jgi:hypothetical protein